MTRHTNKIESVKSHFNIINLMKLRDHLALMANPNSPKPEVGFNMNDYYIDTATSEFPDQSPHNCGTVCCIGGHAAILGGWTREYSGSLSKAAFAQDWLGLTWEDAMILFNGRFKTKNLRNLRNITLKEAIAALDYMIAHGKVPLVLNKD